MARSDPNSREPLDAFRFRASVAVGEIGGALEHGDQVSPDATAAAVSAWSFELLSAANGFLAATSDADEGWGRYR